MRIFLLAIIMMPCVVVAQTGFVVNGMVKGVDNKSLVFIADANNPTDTLASGSVAVNKFQLKGKVAEPGLYTLNFAKDGKKALLFLDNSNVSVNGSIEDIQALEVSGSSTHKDFQQLQTTFNPLFQQLNKLNERAKTTGMNTGLSAESDKLIANIQSQVDQFIGQRKDSCVSAFLLLVTAQLSENAALLESRYNSLNTDIRNGYYAKMVKDNIDVAKVGAIGSDAIEFSQNDPDGKPVSLSSFRGKYVLIDFWASWCGPCRQENPNVVNTFKKFKDRNFTVLGVSLDRSRDPWLKAIKDDKLDWTQVSDLKYWGNEVAQKYKVQGIPRNFLVDPNGKIIARDLRGPQLEQRLAELLK